MLTTWLIVLIFGSQDFHHYWAKLRMRLQVRQLLRVVFLCYLVALPVFSYTLLLYYYFPNSLCLVPAEILHNNTQACLLCNKKIVLQLLGISRNLKAIMHMTHFQFQFTTFCMPHVSLDGFVCRYSNLRQQIISFKHLSVSSWSWFAFVWPHNSFDYATVW